MSLSFSLYIYIYKNIYIYIYIDIYIYIQGPKGCPSVQHVVCVVIVTPGLHNKISAYNIFVRGWVAQEPICS